MAVPMKLLEKVEQETIYKIELTESELEVVWEATGYIAPGIIATATKKDPSEVGRDLQRVYDKLTEFKKK